ncbi:MAG: nickel pincer cofactor biosynthesis protein LarC [Erysipelotrichaceae bacterium]|jgi:uncharacterized protein (TIGR00299 family) protein|nr:nickel pincer cofactor biosynthesis protein LarC [Erysipelotrichaceae bacterium]
MKALYLECGMGISGDMLLGALSELTDQQKFLEIMNHAGIADVSFAAVPQKKCGIAGTHMEVLVHGEEEDGHEHHDHEHHHACMNDIMQQIASLHVSDSVKRKAMDIYRLLAEAESHVHDTDVSEIHFHEVGMKDAIADVVGCCVLMEMINADKVCAGKVAVGNGTVRCAHGILPIPAPAAAYLLQGIPFYHGEVQGELCTPTGAALLKYFADSYGDMPAMRCEKIGYGLGTKDFETANVLRAYLGEAEDTGKAVELICNIDDQSAEEIGHAVDVLFANGALDVYSISAQMKKNRPGILFTCTCLEKDEEKMIRLMFANLTTLGIRRNVCQRYTMQRQIIEEKTSLGTVHIKRSHGYGTDREKIEYTDLAEIADREHLSIAEVRAEIQKERDQK